MRIVAVISPKGGVGKTTVTANLAAELTKSGEHVLALDLDPQNALRFTSPGCGTLILQGIARLQKGHRGGSIAKQHFRMDYLPYGTVDESTVKCLRNRFARTLAGWRKGLAR
jgi:cellulose biosynthesis protein BcsQ